jgi:hypothetical protein
MRAVWLLLLVGCSSSDTKPASKAVEEKPADGIVDRGTFVGGRTGNAVRETFTIERKGDRKIVTTKSATEEGTLETDLDDRPVRAAYTRGPVSFTLGGTPLAIEALDPRMGEQPSRRVTTGPVDIYIAGPGVAALTPLCKVTGETTLATIESDHDLHRRVIQAYRGEPVGTLERIVAEGIIGDLELLCDGPQLVVAALPENDVWLARDDRTADLEALKSAPRPPTHAWKHPVDASEPWFSAQMFVFGNLAVTRDVKRYVERLTTYDLVAHTQIAQRDFDLPANERMYCTAAGARLECHEERTGFEGHLDPRTLADVRDAAGGTDVAMPECEYGHDEILVGKEPFSRVQCGGKALPFAVYLPKTEEQEPNSKVASLARSGKPAWTTTLGTYPNQVLDAGAHLVFGTSDPQRRVIVVDKKSGAIVWVTGQR